MPQAFPNRAFLNRVVRNIEAVADLGEADGTAPDELASYGADGATALATALRRDARLLRKLESAPPRPGEPDVGD